MCDTGRLRKPPHMPLPHSCATRTTYYVERIGSETPSRKGESRSADAGLNITKGLTYNRLC